MKKKWTKQALTLMVLVSLAVFVTACGKKNTKDQDAYRQYGIMCMESGKYKEAAEAFQSALDQSLGKIGEKEIDTCFYKAQAQYLSGDTKAALDTYNAVIEYDQDARAYYLRGNLYFDMGNPDKALADYEKAVKKDKKNYELYIGIYESMSQHDLESDGQKYLNLAMEIKGDKPKDQLNKGRISYLLGDYKNAIELLKEAKEAKQPYALYYMGLAYEAAGNSEQAQSCMEEYINSGDATSYDLYNLGMKAMENEEYKEAVAYFEAGLKGEQVSNKQNLMKALIGAYEHRGDFDSAKSLMKDYRKEYPSDKDAEREEIFLETR